jgi:hypothetical protein
VFAYDASVDRLVAVPRTGPETWLFDMRAGTWSQSGAETPIVSDNLMMGPGVVYDETARRTVVIGNVRLAAYDATADRWEIVAGGEGAPARMWPLEGTVYDPVNRRLLSLVGDGGVVAFDLATNRWTVLLEPRAP